MSENKAKGIVYLINEATQVTEKLSKAELVLEIMEGSYNQKVLFEFINDKTSMLDDVQIGDEVEVYYNLGGREWKSPLGEIKFFNSLKGWKLTNMTTGEAQAPANPTTGNRQRVAPAPAASSNPSKPRSTKGTTTEYAKSSPPPSDNLPF